MTSSLSPAGESIRSIFHEPGCRQGRYALPPEVQIRRIKASLQSIVSPPSQRISHDHLVPLIHVLHMYIVVDTLSTLVRRPNFVGYRWRRIGNWGALACAQDRS